METKETMTYETKPTRSPAVSALAIVGFVALILIAILLAIYAVRFLPAAMSGLGEAAVSLSRTFTPGNDVEVIDQPATPREPGLVVTIPINEGTPTAPASPTTPSAPAVVSPTYPTPTYVPAPTGAPVVVQVPQSGSAVAGYGL